MRVLNQVLQRQETDALDRAIDQWERSKAGPILDAPNPATFFRHRNTGDSSR